MLVYIYINLFILFSKLKLSEIKVAFLLMVLFLFSLKPENVLIDNCGYIRISDFGLSKNNITGNEALSVCGTPEYLAPEILHK